MYRLLTVRKVVLTLSILILLVVGCAPAAPSTPVAPAETGGNDTTTSATAAPAEETTTESALEGTIEFYPHNYYNPEALPEAAQAVESLFADYTKANPGVTVQLVPYVGGSNDYRPWLLTRLSAGEAPNITWEAYSDRNNEREEVWVPLTDYLEQPNPYVAEGQPGSERWGDLFPDYVLAQTRAGDGNLYQVSVDWVETGLFYNKAIFEEAGIEPNWTNLTEFTNDCQALRAAGIEPLGVFMTPEWSTYQWMDDVIFSSVYADVGPSWYIEKYNIESRPFRRMNSEEFARAVHDGNFSVNDPHFDTYLELTKTIADNCLMNGFAGISSDVDMQRLFVEGQVAMAWLSTANAANLAKDGTIDFGLGYFPPITKAENPFAVHEDTSYRVGGPSGPGQYGITQATANEGLLEEALDVLMYVTAPQNFQRIYDPYPNQLAVINGMQSSEVADQFQFVAAMPERLIGDAIARLTPQFGTEHNRLFQQYMLGEISADELKTQYQAGLDQAIVDLCAQQETWEWCAE